PTLLFSLALRWDRSRSRGVFAHIGVGPAGCRRYGRIVRLERPCVMITALVLMNVQRSALNKTAQELLEIPGVAEVYSVTGEYDLVAVLRLKEYDDLADVVTERMTTLGGITKTHTLMAFKVYSKEDLEQAWDIGVE
ncbi:MAG TPA: Lrp/AsnC ligand binding domain-containing protein, partial [Ktedonobacterales bacterium]